MKKILISIFLSTLLIQSAMADVCDYRPSKLIGGGATGAVAGAAGATAATGAGMSAAGFYSIINYVTGATMLGYAGQGIIAGGAVGSVGGALLSPFVIVPAAITAVGVGGYEGGCYLLE